MSVSVVGIITGEFSFIGRISGPGNSLETTVYDEDNDPYVITNSIISADGSVYAVTNSAQDSDGIEYPIFFSSPGSSGSVGVSVRGFINVN